MKTGSFKNHMSCFARRSFPFSKTVGLVAVGMLPLESMPVLGQCTSAQDSVSGDLELRLPFRQGEQYRVTQPYCGFSHTGYQVDFSMPSGTPVLAVAPGVVTQVDEYNGQNCRSVENNCGLTGNQQAGIYVKILHTETGSGASYFSSYLHLSSRLVSPNDDVNAGQVIGYSGNTGWSTAPHLHFHIRKETDGTEVGVRPVPMVGFAVDTGNTPILSFDLGSVYRATGLPIFMDGDRVEAFNVDAEFPLQIRSPDKCSASIGGRVHGDVGIVIDGPSFCENFTRYRIQWEDGTIGWSAQNWLRNAPPPPAPIPVEVAIARAVQVSWPTQDGKLYQVSSSSDLNTWMPFGDPLVGHGVPILLTFETEEASIFYRAEELPGQAADRIPGITRLNLSASNVDGRSSNFSVRNMRVASDVTTLEDAIDAEFVFDTTEQVFRLVSYDVAEDLGVFNDRSSPYFAKDVSPDIYLYKSAGALMEMDQTHTITSVGEDYYMYLEAGHVISFLITDSSDEIRMSVSDDAGDELWSSILLEDVGVITGAVGIRKPGRYTIRFTPRNDVSVNLNVRFLNANRQPLVMVENGSFLNVTFKESIRDYAKFKIHLNKDDILHLEDPSDSNIRFTIVHSSSVRVDSSQGLPLKYQAWGESDYYIFIDNRNGWGGGYSGFVSVEQSVGLQAIGGVNENAGKLRNINVSSGKAVAF